MRLSASQRGNIGLSTGPNGAFLIDDEYAPLTDRVRATVDSLCGCPVRFVLNTHWHRDHTGGNEHLGKAGVLIVAHENTRKRMSVEQFIEAFDAHVPAAPPGALPVVTFTDTITFHLNDDDIRAFHVAPAHTVKAGRSLAQVQAPRPPRSGTGRGGARSSRRTSS